MSYNNISEHPYIKLNLHLRICFQLQLLFKFPETEPSYHVECANLNIAAINITNIPVQNHLHRSEQGTLRSNP